MDHNLSLFSVALDGSCLGRKEDKIIFGLLWEVYNGPLLCLHQPFFPSHIQTAQIPLVVTFFFFSNSVIRFTLSKA